MLKVLQGDCLTVLEGMEKESIDTIYTCPSPFGYYEEYQQDKVGSEKELSKYILHLQNICNHCKPILKKSGSLFIQLGDQFDPRGVLMGIPLWFEGHMKNDKEWLLNDRLIWHRTEKYPLKNYKDKGFLKNYEFIFHYVKNDNFYFNDKSKYARTSVHSYPIEDTYYTNEFDSGLPEQLFRMVIDTTCPENGVTLDPLCGSAKLGVVAKKMNRGFIGIDIDPKTVELCRIRLGIS